MDRRDFLNWGIHGLGATALASLLCAEGRTWTEATNATDTFPQFAPRAKRAIHICLIGGLSHLDSFDFKPELVKYHGKSLDSDEQPDIFFGQVGLLRQSDWAFRQRGESGLWMSDLFPQIARTRR